MPVIRFVRVTMASGSVLTGWLADAVWDCAAGALTQEWMSCR